MGQGKLLHGNPRFGPHHFIRRVLERFVGNRQQGAIATMIEKGKHDFYTSEEKRTANKTKKMGARMNVAKNCIDSGRNGRCGLITDRVVAVAFRRCDEGEVWAIAGINSRS
jgi:hypothetical protein